MSQMTDQICQLDVAPFEDSSKAPLKVTCPKVAETYFCMEWFHRGLAFKADTGILVCRRRVLKSMKLTCRFFMYRHRWKALSGYVTRATSLHTLLPVRCLEPPEGSSTLCGTEGIHMMV